MSQQRYLPCPSSPGVVTKDNKLYTHILSPGIHPESCAECEGREEGEVFSLEGGVCVHVVLVRCSVLVQ